MIQGFGVYEFAILGDGIDKELVVALRALKAPAPFRDDASPSGLVGVQVGPTPGGGTVTLEGECARIKFDAPPAYDKPTTIKITALFGADRI